MTNFTIYHNPRCSKSRQTLEILNEQEAQVEIVLYLENPPSAKEIQSLLVKLGLCSREIIRKGEDVYKHLNLIQNDPYYQKNKKLFAKGKTNHDQQFFL